MGCYRLAIDERETILSYNEADNMSPFCPYCGAKMITREKE